MAMRMICWSKFLNGNWGRAPTCQQRKRKVLPMSRHIAWAGIELADESPGIPPEGGMTNIWTRYFNFLRSAGMTMEGTNSASCWSDANGVSCLISELDT